VLGRLLPPGPEEPARIAALAALEQTAGALQAQASADVRALAGSGPPLTAPLQLLIDDLRLLIRLRAR